MMIQLKTHRLLLRSFQEGDLDAFAGYRSDPEVARYQSWDVPYTPGQARALFEQLKHERPGTPGSWYQLAVERQDQPGIIGDCAFQVMKSDPQQAEIGFTFSRLFQKQGFAAEAVKRLLDYLFGDLRLHRVIAVCDTKNMNAARLLDRVGMRREGHFIENIWFKGSWGSEYSYAVLDWEWRLSKADGVLKAEN